MNSTIPTIASDTSAAEILRIGIETASGPVSLACSFSMEDVAIIDIAHQAGLNLGVFALDTGRLNEETYEVADALVERYRLKIDWYFPRHDDVENLERADGLFSFRESLDKRHQCCAIRKVEPLSRALKGLSGWVTGMRREQAVTRGDLPPVEVDELNGGLLKINPLLAWTEEQLLAYTEEQRLPRNRLYSQGYRSIGCAPCTRAVKPGEDARAGRWWWENPENKECGLHRR
ncbi:phosphoadenylyl-sulfate reductase [Pelotalea chapellei]|uniref:Adenosine 5'-phosphosulfate reductase n=1 Tax=Pelotalea chapellei TaxID=44671 RepID=A0ABS5UD78_9BACT|nr:phosphoadenylyl-sulfate reductase [Pelotalea chapellei]MBT1073596.1 phosphoadenylyl-sulfate reductase [Pelotalea chapellei]